MHFVQWQVEGSLGLTSSRDPFCQRLVRLAVGESVGSSSSGVVESVSIAVGRGGWAAFGAGGAAGVSVSELVQIDRETADLAAFVAETCPRAFRAVVSLSERFGLFCNRISSSMDREFALSVAVWSHQLRHVRRLR